MSYMAIRTEMGWAQPGQLGMFWSGRSHLRVCTRLAHSLSEPEELCLPPFSSFASQDSGVTAGARLGVTGFLSNTRVVLFKKAVSHVLKTKWGIRCTLSPS